jgi:uncharacterized protein (DUF1697 family)
MPRYVAFLRAINVGGHTVKMERLRALFAELGYGEVETFIASGNVAFRADGKDEAALEAEIEPHLQRGLGYAVATFVRTPAELAKVAALRPFAAADLDAPGHALHVAFLKRAPAKEAAKKLLELRGDYDDFHVRGREAYWLVRGRLSDSTLTPARLEKTLGVPATLRNATTVRKLAAKYLPE